MPLLAYFALRGSLPKLDGEVHAAELSGPVALERDALGTVTLSGETRADLAYATGYAHAQDRFFQMDLSRRLASGELRQLVGEVAAEQDARSRAFGFRKIARAVLKQTTPQQRGILDAYTRGVNAGLASLRARPFEYWLLRKRPVKWRAEDSFLIVLSMWYDLQYSGLKTEQLRRRIDERLGGAPMADGWKRASCFFSPPRSSWDAPNISGSSRAPEPPTDCQSIPSPEELTVRGHSAQGTGGHEPEAAQTGSNNWALAGSLTAGGALVAGDMHLGLRVPGVWYRARLRGAGLDLNGLTMPGAPVMVVGSNGYIAWSFTNSYGDWQGVTRRSCTAAGVGVRFDGPDERGDCWFANWLAAVPAATNLRLIDLESVHSAAAAVALAPEIGIPQQNLIVGDREGHIAWTIIGRIPRATGPQRSAGTSGWLAAGEQPAIFDPPEGRLWSANALSTDDVAQQRAIGGDEAGLGAHYDVGARAQQIRNDLRALTVPATEADMLAVQLDDRAVFLTRWRELLLGELDAAALDGHPDRAELKAVVESWEGRAAPTSDGYRLVRGYRDQVAATVWQMMLAALDLSGASEAAPARFEQPLWTLVSERPMHLLADRYPGWHDLLLAAVDATIATARRDCGAVRGCRWGDYAPVAVRHPLSHALPWLAPYIDMPVVPLDGDSNMPRVMLGAFGASERFAVRPGHESEGYMHIAGGASGHPLSPYYRAGFAEWANGTRLPFLPGAAQHRLVLTPR